jgi:amino acid adenylation domain-containing protein
VTASTHPTGPVAGAGLVEIGPVMPLTPGGDHLGTIATAWVLVSERLGPAGTVEAALTVDGSPRRVPAGSHLVSLSCRELAALVERELLDGAVTASWSALLEVVDDGHERCLMVRVRGNTSRLACDAAADVTANLLPHLHPDQRVGAVRDVLDVLVSATSRRTADRSPCRITCDAGRLARMASDHPSDAAVAHRHGTVDYATLAARAGGLAASLTRCGVGRGSVVATVLDKGPTAIAAALGAWCLGASYVHIDPLEPAGRVARLLGAVDATCVVTERTYAGPIGTATPPTVLADDTGEAPFDPLGPAEDTDLAYLVLTSGSTGMPKAVEITHGALRTYVAGFLDRLGQVRPESYATTTTLASDLGNTCIFAALATGARIDLYERDEVLDRDLLAQRLARDGVDCIKYTPSQLASLSRGDVTGLLPRRVLVLGGERLRASLAHTVLTARPDLAVFNHYGPSETTIGVLMHGPLDPDPTASDLDVPLGAPLAGVTTDLVDTEGRPLIDGARGLLRVAGPSVARGYRNAGPDGHRAFGHLPDGTPTFLTGDVVERDEHGDLRFVGRIDQQVKVRGHRVEPAEVEAHIVAVDGVRQVATHVEMGDDGAMLTAFVELDGGVEARDVLRALAAQVPPQLVPARIQAVNRLPLTANGKLDLGALAGAALPTVVAAPSDDVERALTELWRRVLGHGDFTIDDRFLEVGGNSFMVLEVFAALREAHPQLTIADLFDHPTVSGLARALRSQERPGPAATFVEL